MKAICFDGRLSVRETTDPVARESEALVRVRMAGICNTDLEIVRGYMGFEGVLGHEMVGVVERCEDRAWIGKRVAGEINLACRTCATCARGLERHCPHRTVLGILGKDGCHAELVTLPVANLHAIPDDVSDERALFVEPLAAALEIAAQVHVSPEHRVAILGDGKLGLLAALALSRTGCDLTLVGRHVRKMDIAKRAGVATLREDAVRDRAYDVVVEATGSPGGLDLALRALAPRGTLVLKSTFHGTPSVRTAAIVIDELTVVGSRCGAFGPSIRALTAIDPTPLLDEVMRLEDGAHAYERAASNGVLKVALDLR